MTILVSIICPIYNEEKFIVGCVESVLRQDYPHELMEVLFVDGRSTDKTRELLQPCLEKYPNIKLLDNPHKTVPYAMNIAIRDSVGEVIVRIDAHAHYPENYVSVLVHHLLTLPNAENVGAACSTQPRKEGRIPLAIREVLCNRFGVGNAQFRMGVEKIMEVDTVPFGCWKRGIFDKVGYFDERLTRNQDIELNKRIARGGGKIYLVPGTYSTYMARSTYKDLAKNNYANGKWNILTVRYTKQIGSLSLRHFIPMLFLLSLILPLIAAIFWWPMVFVTLLGLCMYLLAMGGVCIYLSVSKHLNFMCLLWAFLVLHLSYGTGSLVGLFKKL